MKAAKDRDPNQQTQREAVGELHLQPQREADRNCHSQSQSDAGRELHLYAQKTVDRAPYQDYEPSASCNRLNESQDTIRPQCLGEKNECCNTRTGGISNPPLDESFESMEGNFEEQMEEMEEDENSEVLADEVEQGVEVDYETANEDLDDIEIAEYLIEENAEESDDEPVENLQDQHNVENNDESQDQLLYAGAPVTVAQSMLLVLVLMLKHDLTQSCISDVLAVINLICLRESMQKTSLFRFQKFFSLSEAPVLKHFYCSHCCHDLRSADSICPSCEQRKGVSYFLELPFIDQLQEMYRRNGFYESLQHRFQRPNLMPDTVEDIYDAKLYKMLVENGFLSNIFNISFTWYTDGAQVFKSSKTSIWPFYLTINELPFKERTKRENLILAGLWFGTQKPSANDFIHAFRPQFERLHLGLQLEVPGHNVITVRGALLFRTCDLMAKYQFLNILQFNSTYGCPCCLCITQSIRIDSGATVKVFPYQSELTSKSSRESVQHAEIALQEERPVLGIKGPSAFASIMLHYICGTVIDRMHAIDGSVVKKLLTVWFNSKYSTFPFLLLPVIHIINQRLVSIKPPKFVHRMPRSVEDLCHWKASELKMWFFYYSIPIFSGVMRSDLFNHYVLLVIGISILNSDTIPRRMITVANQLLHKFVKEFEILYGLQFCSINIHQVLHLSECVSNNGPLWSYTCYPYEDINGKFIRLVHGTTHVDSQIVRSHCQLVRTKRKLDELPEGPINDFCFNQKHPVKICERLQNNTSSVGRYKKIVAIDFPIRKALANSNIAIVSVRKYSRLLKNCQLYVSESYTRTLQTISSYVRYLDNGKREFGAVHCFIKATNDCDCGDVCYCAGVHYAFCDQ